jgi:hypothetical protein
MGGTFNIIDATPSWIRSKVTGRFDEAACRQVISAVDQWRGNRTGLICFSDVSAVDDYDVAARELVSTWLRDLGATFTQVHILVSGRAIAWAIRIVGVVSGAKIISYHSPAAFEEAFQRSIEAGRRDAI